MRTEERSTDGLVLWRWTWIEDPQRRGVVSALAARHEQPVQFRDKQTSSGTSDRRNTGHRSVQLLLLLEDLDKAFATDYVDPLPLGIDEDVVGIAAGRQAGLDLAVSELEDRQLGRFPEHAEQDPIRTIQGHREVRLGSRNFPGLGLLAQRAIHHRDLVRFRHVDEDQLAGRIELK